MKKWGLKKILMIAVPAVIVIGAAVWFLLPDSYDKTELTKKDIDSTVKVTGTVNGSREQTIYACASGKISDSALTTGSRVNKGDVIAAYDTTSLENEILLAQDALDVADGTAKDAKNLQSGYAGLYQNSAEELVQYESEMVILTSQINDVLKKQESNANAINNAMADHEGKIANLSRDYEAKNAELQAVIDAGGDSTALQTEVNNLKTKLKDEQNKLSSINGATLSTDDYAYLLSLQTRLSYVSSRIEAARSLAAAATEGKISSSGMNAYNASVKQMQDTLDIAKAALAKAEAGVVAPESGIVIEKYVDEGAVVECGQELYRMQTTDDFIVHTTVSKFDIAKVKEGQIADVKLGNTIYKGHVSSINPVAVADASGKAKIRVDVKIDNPDENLILGIEAEVTIHVGEAKEANSLPIAAVYSDDEGDYVYVLSDSKPKKTYVTTGLSDGEYTEIVSGINPNDKIALNVGNTE